MRSNNVLPASGFATGRYYGMQLCSLQPRLGELIGYGFTED